MPDSPPSGGRAAAVASPLAVLCATQFVLQLDFSIVNVALETIRGELGFSAAALQWVVTSYALTFGSLLLLGGRLGDRVGRRRLMVVGLWIFAAASLAGGLATSPGVLVAARFVQGAGAAMVAPSVVAMLTATHAEGPERTRALGVWTAATAGGATAGIVAGGLLTQLFGWRAVFLVNLPLIAVLLPLVRRSLPELPGTPGVRIEVRSAVLFVVAVAALILGLSSGERDGFGAPLVLAALATSACCAVLFGVVDRGAATPMLPRSFLRPRARWTAGVVMLALGGVLASYAFVLALHLQRVMNYDEARTAFALVPSPLTIAVVSMLLARRVIGRFGAPAVMLAGLLALAAGQLWFSGVSADGTYLGRILPALVLTATGFGLVLPAASVGMTQSVGPGEQGLAGGLLSTAQQVGAALGLAILATVAAAGTAHGGTLVAGYRLAFLGAAGIALAAAVVVAIGARRAAAPPG